MDGRGTYSYQFVSHRCDVYHFIVIFQNYSSFVGEFLEQTIEQLLNDVKQFQTSFCITMRDEIQQHSAHASAYSRLRLMVNFRKQWNHNSLQYFLFICSTIRMTNQYMNE